MRIRECGLQQSECVACLCHKILHSATFPFGTLEASSLIFWKLANPLDAPASKAQGDAALKTVLWTPTGSLPHLRSLHIGNRGPARGAEFWVGRIRFLLAERYGKPWSSSVLDGIIWALV